MRASAIQHALSQNQKICEKEAEIAALRKRYERLTARKRQVKNMTG
jgi:FixJ family two-component response regulator